jgi:creatinine amidohydrolase
MSTNRWWELTGSEFDEVSKSIAILPVGTIERHGDHLPLGTDALIPIWLAERVANKLNAVVLPPVYYGSSKTLARFGGTIDIDAEVFSSYVREIMREALRNGVKLLIIINGHGGNSTPLALAAKQVAYSNEGAIVIINWWSDIAQDIRSELFEAPGHAGEDETSATMYVAPKLVNLAKAKPYIRPYPRIKIYSKEVDKELYPFAVNGDPTKATSEKGEKFLKAVVEEIIEVIEDLLKKYRWKVEGSDPSERFR